MFGSVTDWYCKMTLFWIFVLLCYDFLVDYVSARYVSKFDKDSSSSIPPGLAAILKTEKEMLQFFSKADQGKATTPRIEAFEKSIKTNRPTKSPKIQEEKLNSAKLSGVKIMAKGYKKHKKSHHHQQQQQHHHHHHKPKHHEVSRCLLTKLTLQKTDRLGSDEVILVLLVLSVRNEFAF